MSFFSRTCALVIAVLCARAAVAQDREFGGGWEPFGPVAVDQAGSGRRGYALAGEGTDVAVPGASEFSLHTVTANDFYIEANNNMTISQRDETHSLAFEYRRGFTFRTLPRFEVGAQIQLHQSDTGFLNGFIGGFEDLVHASLRSKLAVLPPLGMTITQNGRVLYQSSGSGSGVGDLYLVAKAAVRDADPSSLATRVAVRVAANVSGASVFTEGNFVGAGVSVDRKIFDWMALHGDIRANVTLDRMSQWNLPLRRGVAGYSFGPEFKVTRNTSLSLQADGTTTPYQTTGTIGLDSNYGAAALGVNHRFTAGQRQVVAQLYARENMDMPFSVRWNTDPDFAVGLKVTIH